MKCVKIDVKEKSVTVVNPKNDWKELAKECNCSYIAMAPRAIGGRYFTIICDEDGGLKQNQRASAVDKDKNTMFVGNILIGALSNLEDETSDLSEDDISHILSNICMATFQDGQNGPILTNMTYK